MFLCSSECYKILFKHWLSWKWEVLSGSFSSPTSLVLHLFKSEDNNNNWDEGMNSLYNPRPLIVHIYPTCLFFLPESSNGCYMHSVHSNIEGEIQSSIVYSVSFRAWAWTPWKQSRFRVTGPYTKWFIKMISLSLTACCCAWYSFTNEDTEYSRG